MEAKVSIMVKNYEVKFVTYVNNKQRTIFFDRNASNELVHVLYNNGTTELSKNILSFLCHNIDSKKYVECNEKLSLSQFSAVKKNILSKQYNSRSNGQYGYVEYLD